jgi:hypothetical protein
LPQRKEDYMSTKNVGGKRLGGTDAGHNDPFSYLKQSVGKNHGYLGHFKQEKFLRKGHNEVAPRPGVIVAPAQDYTAKPNPSTVVDVVGQPQPRVSTVFPAPGMQAAPPATPSTSTRARYAKPGALGPVTLTPPTMTTAPGVRTPRAARQTRAQRFAAEHPVIAARRAINQTRKAGTNVSPAQALAAIRTARANPNSAYSEARARRGRRGIV